MNQKHGRPGSLVATDHEEPPQWGKQELEEESGSESGVPENEAEGWSDS